jgi:NAD(P)-dependent dehydrogenase (short-subunit alcohol dehydrogenase family)
MGYSVCVNYLSNQAAAAAVASDIEAAGAKAIAVQADVSRESDVMRLYEAIDQNLGTLSALINNAGILPGMSPIDDMDEDRLNNLWAVNLTSLFLCAREAVKRMSTSRGGAGGAIVNLSSAAARMGGPGQFLDYAASKGAADVFNHGLALELAPQGIRVNAVRPGLIDTDIHASAGAPDRVAQLAHMIPMGRAGSPEEVAETIMWLLSDKASYVTDSIVDVAGGR